MEKDQNLQKKAASNMIWKFGERMLAQLISFIVQLVLARILMPEDFGTIAIVNVFITLFNVLVTSGLGTALIQKKDSDEYDFSSVFWFNIIFSLVLYSILFLCAPLIATFYNNDSLIPIVRILSLQILLSGIKTVQQAIVARRLQFRKFFWATFSGTIISGFVGVYLAYNGAGVWALVSQHLTNSTIDIIILFIVMKWKPLLFLSWKRLKPLVVYGWKILASSLINAVYVEIRVLIIGKRYSSEELAYYERGKKFPDLISDNVIITIESVLFPVLAIVQDDKRKVKSVVRRFIKTSSFLMTPMLVGFAAIAEPFVKLILTDKWLFCIPYIYIYCIVNSLRPMQTANQQMIKAVGRSELTLKIEIIKKTIGMLILLISMRYGVLWIALSNILYSIIVLFVNAAPAKKLIGYGYFEQLIDIMPAIVASLIMGCFVYFTNIPGISLPLTIILKVLVGIVVYWVIAKLTKMESYRYTLDLIKAFTHRG